MTGNIAATLASASASLAGLFLLHRFFRTRSAGGKQIGVGKALLFAAAALVLMALPVLTWSGLLTARHDALQPRVSPTSLLLLAGYLDAAFLWLIWNINSYCFPMREPYANPWEEYWGEPYSPELKRRLLEPIFEHLDRTGALGDVVVDIGSGAVPVSGFLPTCPTRKCILIDIAAKNESTRALQYLRFDITHIARPALLSYRKALVRVCKFLACDPGAASPQQATTLLFSDILNYVDFRETIERFAQFLKPGGRIVIANLPTRGIREHFSADGLKKNEDLYSLLEDLNFIIEDKQFPCRLPGATEESEEMIVLVARKRERACAS